MQVLIWSFSFFRAIKSLKNLDNFINNEDSNPNSLKNIKVIKETLLRMQPPRKYNHYLPNNMNKGNPLSKQQ